MSDWETFWGDTDTESQTQACTQMFMFLPPSILTDFLPFPSTSYLRQAQLEACKHSASRYVCTLGSTCFWFQNSWKTQNLNIENYPLPIPQFSVSVSSSPSAHLLLQLLPGSHVAFYSSLFCFLNTHFPCQLFQTHSTTLTFSGDA